MLLYSRPNRLNIIWEDWGEMENRLYRNQRQPDSHLPQPEDEKKKAETKVKGSQTTDKLAEMVASPVQSNNGEDEAALMAKLQALQVTEESLEKKKGLEDMNR